MTVLEAAAEEFARAAAQRPPLDQLGPVAARRSLEDVQAGGAPGPDVDSSWVNVTRGEVEVRARIVRPWDSGSEVLPVVVYLHGGGWVLGSAATHDRLVRELAVGAHAALVFVEFDRAPEAPYPVALHQAHAVARWVREHGAEAGLDATRMAVAGDSAGGNLAAALAIHAKEQGEDLFVHQSLYYPVTDGAQDTDSYREFADGPHLTAASMAWFWDCYLPRPADRLRSTASPLRAPIEELAGLPETFVLVDEYDVLRDEGEAYAARLTEAGVRCSSVRYNGTLHDFMMLDPLRSTAAATSAVAQAISVLDLALHGKSRPPRPVVPGRPPAPAG
jgi:acetyl esterase/lipase